MTVALRQPPIAGRRTSDRVPAQWWEGEFADWLRQAMADRDLSMRMLSMRAGINHSTICRLLKGDRDPTLTTALALLRVLAAEPLRVRPDISLLAD